MPIYNPTDNSCLVLIKAAEGTLIERHTWIQGSLFQQLKSGGYGKYSVINITRIDDRLCEYCADPGVKGLNTSAEDELNAIRTKIDTMKQVEKQLNDKEHWDYIFHDYLKELEAHNCTPIEYFTEKALICMNYKKVMYRHFTKFKEFYAIKQEVYGDGAEERSLQESLDHFLESHNNDKSGAECL